MYLDFLVTHFEYHCMGALQIRLRLHDYTITRLHDYTITRLSLWIQTVTKNKFKKNRLSKRLHRKIVNAELRFSVFLIQQLTYFIGNFGTP
jgi:hypothetical protein